MTKKICPLTYHNLYEFRRYCELNFGTLLLLGPGGQRQYKHVIFKILVTAKA